MLVDETTHQLVIEAVAGATPRNARGSRLHLGEGVTGEAAARGQTIYVPDVTLDPRYRHCNGTRLPPAPSSRSRCGARAASSG